MKYILKLKTNNYLGTCYAVSGKHNFAPFFVDQKIGLVDDRTYAPIYFNLKLARCLIKIAQRHHINKKLYHGSNCKFLIEIVDEE